MDEQELSSHVEAVRAFNRFYTRQIGLLQEGLLDSPYSLTEARLIYELAHNENTTASALSATLGLDAGYLSRTLKGFTRRGLLEKSPSPNDARQSSLRLTASGQEAFTTLNARSHSDIAAMLARLTVDDQRRLVGGMSTIRRLLDDLTPDGRQAIPYLLRQPRPGDMGWVVQRHGALYHEEYGWDETFEALVAEIVAEFIRNFDSQRERCWIAEIDGENVGSIFLVKKSDTVAKLRLLLLEPRPRGRGIGKRLTEECIRYARQVGYKKMVLWTNSILLTARDIYRKAGFTLTESEPHHSFGKDLVGETWEADL